MADTQDKGFWGVDALELGDLAGMPEAVFRGLVAPKLRARGIMVSVEAIDAPPDITSDTLVPAVG